MKTTDYQRSEKYLEKELIKAVDKIGGKAVKFYSHIAIGYPDRLILLPGGKTAWVEMKSTGEKPTKIQRYRHTELQSLGFKVFVIDSLEGIQALTTELNQMIKD